MENYTTIDRYEESPAERDARREEHEEMVQRLHDGDQADKIEQEIQNIIEEMSGCDRCSQAPRATPCTEHAKQIDDRRTLLRKLDERNGNKL